MSTISKYFKVLSENINSDLSNTSDSPYKNVLNEVKAIDFNSSNESNDFKTPKPIPKTRTRTLVKKNAVKKTVRRNLSKPKKPSSPAKDKAKKTDCNLEHLQMAIALSKSLQTEDGGETNSCFNKNDAMNSKVSLMEVLQQYQFQSNSSKLDPLNRRPVVERKKTKSKFQYIRPVLLLRTHEDREKMITDKIFEILLSNTTPRSNREIVQENPFSEYLQRYYNCEQKIFSKSRHPNEVSLNDFYVSSLNIDQCCVKCGSSLKNWHSIPGRSVTPVRTVINTDIPQVLDNSAVTFESPLKNWHEKPSNSTEMICVPRTPILVCESVETLTSTELLHSSKVLDNSRCLSPDLFDSEDECFKSPILKCRSTESNKIDNSDSPLELNSLKDKLEASTSGEFFENENGICVFESFSDKNLCVDLTQSSDSECEENNAIPEHERSLKTGVTETFEKIVSLASSDDTIDYVNKLLEAEAERKIKQPVKFGDEHEELYSKEINLSCLVPKHHLSYELPQLDSDLEVFEIDRDQDNSARAEVNFSLAKCGSFTSTNSEESICISDDEINYSCFQSTPTKAQRKRRISNKGSFYSLSEDSDTDTSTVPSKEFDKKHSSPLSSPINKIVDNSYSLKQDAIIEPPVNHDLENTVLYTMSPSSDRNIDSEIENTNRFTPKTEVNIKSINVTPMADYNEMNTPKIVKELDKFGLKPLKRQRGVQLLKYIYETTHPLVNNTDHNFDDNDRIKKKRKVDKNEEPFACDISLTKEDVASTSNNLQRPKTGKNILGANEELIFERKQSKKVLSCMVPLHIAWYNLVTSDPTIQKKILLYEPLQFEDLYRTLKSHGYKYHIQDVLTFLDKKCITIRTEQISRPRHKQHKKSRTQLFSEEV